MAAAIRKCMECRQRAVARTVLPSYTTDIEHDGRSYRITVPNFEVLQCQECKAVVIDEQADDRLYAALRQEVGLLSPEEIVANRKKLGLTQSQLAGFLRIADSTLSRWETGAQIQQKAMDALLRVYFQSTEARIILGGPVGAASAMHGVHQDSWRPSTEQVLNSAEG